MKLGDWLRQESMTNDDFGKMVGVHPISVSKYRSGTMIPRRGVMDAIVKATDGSVSADDFFSAPAEQAA